MVTSSCFVMQCGIMCTDSLPRLSSQSVLLGMPTCLDEICNKIASGHIDLSVRSKRKDDALCIIINS